MTHPDWALKHKVKNSEIRNIRGSYCLYEITSKWDPIKKRSKKVTLGMLGTITEKDGFIARGQRKKGRPVKEKEPNYYRLFPGNIHGESALQEQVRINFFNL